MAFVAAVLADTGPPYSVVDPRDQLHLQTRTELRRFASSTSEVHAAASTVVEAFSLMLYRLGSPTAHRWLTDLTRRAAIHYPTPDDYGEALATISRFPDQDITVADAVIFVLSRRLGLPIWTDDHHFDIPRANRWHPA